MEYQRIRSGQAILFVLLAEQHQGHVLRLSGRETCAVFAIELPHGMKHRLVDRMLQLFAEFFRFFGHFDGTSRGIIQFDVDVIAFAMVVMVVGMLMVGALVGIVVPIAIFRGKRFFSSRFSRRGNGGCFGA